MKHPINHLVVASGRRHICCPCHEDALLSFLWVSGSIIITWMVCKWIMR